MNILAKNQIASMIMTSEQFKEHCKFAVTSYDGKISKKDMKALKRLESATNKFIAQLNSIARDI